MPKGGKQRLRERLSSVLYVKARRLEIQKVWWWWGVCVLWICISCVFAEVMLMLVSLLRNTSVKH